MKFRFIEDHRDIWPVRLICDALEVSHSGYYAWRGRRESPRGPRLSQSRQPCP